VTKFIASQDEDNFFSLLSHYGFCINKLFGMFVDNGPFPAAYKHPERKLFPVSDATIKASFFIQRLNYNLLKPLQSRSFVYYFPFVRELSEI
jgi:hypothetical protein